MPTISQRIALEGGEEIRRQLQAMGKAGEASFEQIESAGVSLAQSLDRVIRSVARLEASFVALKASAGGFSQSVGRMGAAFGAFESAVTRTVRNITLLGAAVGAATVGFGALVKGAANAADNIGEQAAGLGITTDRYQELAAAATDSGIDQEKFGRGLGNLAKKVQEGDATLRRLGITGRTVDTAFLQLADVFARLPDGLKKTNLAMEIFGARMGRAFIDMLNKGRAGIEELGLRFAAMKFTEPEIKIGDELSKQFIILGYTATQAFNKLALLFGPQMSRVLSGFSDMVIAHFPRISQTIEGFVRNSVEPAITDLFRLLNGDVMEIKTPWVVELGIKFFELKNIIVQAGEFIAGAFQKLRSAADSAAGIFNRIFGTNITGDALLLAAAVLKVTGILSVFTSLVTAAGTAMLVLVSATGLAIRAIGLFGAGVATLTTFLSTAGLGGAVGALVRILAGLAALVFTPAGVIAGLGLVAAAFLFTSQETQQTWLAMFASLGETALSALTGIAQTIRNALNIRPDATLFEGLATAAGAVVGFIFDKFANLGQSINRIFLSLEGPLNNFFARLGPELIGTMLGSMASLLPAVLNVGLTIGKLLGQGIARAVAESDPRVIFEPLLRAMQEAGGPAGKAFADAFLRQLQGVRKEAAEISDEIQRSWKPGADPGSGLDAAAGKATQLDDALKQVAGTVGSLGTAFDGLGPVGSKAFQSIKTSAEQTDAKIADINKQAAADMADLSDKIADTHDQAASKIISINAQAANSMADLRAEAGRLLSEARRQATAIREIDEQQGVVGKEKIIDRGEDASRLEEQLAAVYRKMRELEEGRARQIAATTDAELKGVEDLQKKMRELEEGRAKKVAATAEAEGKNSEELRKQTQELELQERLRQHTIDAARFRGKPLGGPDAGVQPPAGAQPPGAAAVDTISGVLAQLGAVVQQVSSDLQTLGLQAFAASLQELTAAASSAAQTLKDIAVDTINSALAELGAAVQQVSSDLQTLGLEAFATSLQELTTAANSAAQALKDIQAGGDMTELAAGGLIHGPGTPTSDSILARLSRGEYVVRAAAVRHYGPALLSAINSMRIPRPTGFNMGGLVDGMQRSLAPLMIPRFAEGGLADMALANGRRPIALTINAGGARQTFDVWADEAVADKVVRYTISRQVASAGRKSGAFG